MTSAADAVTSRVPVRTLSSDDYLQLMIKKLANQDPMNPQSDTDFLAQMAQFTSLEQTNVMQQELTRLREDQAIVKAESLLGRTVELQIDNETKTSGVVNAVRIDGGRPLLLVQGAEYELDQVTRITAAPTEK